jgi:methylmalonyl-CoA mutase N-terminal domain/subunit
MGGSFAIEAMTDEIEDAAGDYIRKIDDMGGTLRAIEQGYVQREIQESAYRFQKDVEAGNRIIVGVNRYTEDRGDVPPELLQVDESVGEEQRSGLAKLRSERDQKAASRALDELHQAAKADENLMPFILSAVESLASIGEIADCLRKVFGEYTESVVF